MSSANHLERWRGRGGMATATPRGQNHVNNFNYFFFQMQFGAIKQICDT